MQYSGEIRYIGSRLFLALFVVFRRARAFACAGDTSEFAGNGVDGSVNQLPTIEIQHIFAAGEAPGRDPAAIFKNILLHIAEFAVHIAGPAVGFSPAVEHLVTLFSELVRPGGDAIHLAIPVVCGEGNHTHLAEGKEWAMVELAFIRGGVGVVHLLATKGIMGVEFGDAMDPFSVI